VQGGVCGCECERGSSARNCSVCIRYFDLACIRISHLEFWVRMAHLGRLLVICDLGRALYIRIHAKLYCHGIWLVGVVLAFITPSWVGLLCSLDKITLNQEINLSRSFEVFDTFLFCLGLLRVTGAVVSEKARVNLDES
jgi:hypothetical protein